MYKIERLTAADYEDAMDFMNMVFSLGSEPTDFPLFLPKLYQPDDDLMHCHYAIRREGKIRAVVGSYPLTLKTGTHSLKTAGIGGVSTHPNDRRSGLMRSLMQQALADMRKQGLALSVLGGQRQRYAYYGYERSGTTLVYHLSRTNLRHALAAESLPALRYVCLAASRQAADQVDGSLDEAWYRQALAAMISWHQNQPAYVERSPDAFLETLISWKGSVWLACDQENQPVGYLVKNPRGEISEILAGDPSLLRPMLASWLDQQPQPSVRILLAPWQQAYSAELGRLSESWQVQSSYNIQIFDWPRVLQALLQLKADLNRLPPGRICFQLKEPGQVYELLLADGEAICRASESKPDFCLDSLTATRLFLGPLSAEQIAPELCGQNFELTACLLSWLPLPMHWPLPDGI